VAIIFLVNLFQPVDPTDQQLVRFVVPKGASMAEVASKLEAEGLIKSKWSLRLFVKLNPHQTQVQAGSFELSKSMDLTTILETLNQGTDDVWVTFPEGLRREEIALSLTKYDLVFYDEDEFLSQTVGLEGRLFPETYLVPKEITSQELINLFTNTFEAKLKPYQDLIDRSEFSFNEILTMASILEREGRGLNELRQVAGVLYRRLDMGMPLQVDASLQYAKGYNQQTASWWSPPLAVDKELDSPFNTYMNPGLPPRPICNPGIEAIEAALTPVDAGYLFYIHDNKGQIHFAATLEEHNANVNTYLR